MIQSIYKDLFWTDSLDKQLTLTFSNGDILTNESIYSESMSIEESLCSTESLSFGACEASCFSIRVVNNGVSHANQTVTVGINVDNQTTPFIIGTYTVTSDIVASNKAYRDIVAYDAMQSILSADVTEWYNNLFSTHTTITLLEFRNAFFTHLNITQVNSSLINDTLEIERTIGVDDNSIISGQLVINAICELNGCFGHITRDNKFDYILLTAGLYPSDDLYPSSDIYPNQGSVEAVDVPLENYKTLDHADYLVKSITAVHIKQEENDLGASYAISSENTYIVQNNFLVYGKSTEELQGIAQKILSVISGIIFCPLDNFQVKGNFCIEVGDSLNVQSRDGTYVSTICLHRTVTGIQSLWDTIISPCSKVVEPLANSSETQILNLRGKTAVLKKTIEEVSSTLTNALQNISSEFKQTASSISLTVTQLSDDTKSVGITVGLKNKDGEEVVSETAGIDLSGLVTFKNLETEGETVINGGNVTTQTIKLESFAEDAIDKINYSATQASDYISSVEEGTMLSNITDEDASGNIVLTNTGMKVRNGTTVLAEYGKNVYIYNAYNRLVITNQGMQLEWLDPNTNEYEITAGINQIATENDDPEIGGIVQSEIFVNSVSTDILNSTRHNTTSESILESLEISNILIEKDSNINALNISKGLVVNGPIYGDARQLIKYVDVPVNITVPANSYASATSTATATLSGYSHLCIVQTTIANQSAGQNESNVNVYKRWVNSNGTCYVAVRNFASSTQAVITVTCRVLMVRNS